MNATPVPYGYFKSQESRFFQAETWAITGPEHDHEESWDIVADGIANEDTARFIVTACNCHVDLLEALEDIQSALSMCGKGNSKVQLLNQVKYANGRIVKAIRKAAETP